MTILPLLPKHWPAVKAIYEDGLATGNASFQTSAPGWEEWDAAHLKHSRFGTREKIGQMNGVWRDTVLLERRSKTVAI